MKLHTLIVHLFALVAAVLTGCTQQSIQSTFDRQETQIASFVTARQNADEHATVVYKNGSVRITLHDTLAREGLRADSLALGGTISFYYAGYTLSGTSVSASNLFATNRKETADESRWRITDTTVFKIQTTTLDDTLVEGLRNGLEGVRSQDECYILFSGKYGFGYHSQGTIPAKSALVYHIWVNSISNE